jgi:hypothetical protein
MHGFCFNCYENCTYHCRCGNSGDTSGNHNLTWRILQGIQDDTLLQLTANHVDMWHTDHVAAHCMSYSSGSIWHTLRGRYSTCNINCCYTLLHHICLLFWNLFPLHVYVCVYLWPTPSHFASVKLTAHLYIVPRLRLHGAIPPLPQ